MDIYCYKYDATTGSVVLSGIVDNFESFSFSRSYSGIGSFTLVLNGSLEQAKYLLASDIIRAGKGVCGLITHTSEARSDDGYTLTVTGQELKSLASKRIVIPPTGYAHLDLWGIAPARLVRRLLETQLTYADEEARRIPGDVVVDEGAEIDGQLVDYQGRYSGLRDDIVTICTTFELGWYADIENTEIGNIIVWHLFRGIDRTAGQNDNSRLLLSYKYDTIAQARFDASRHAASFGIVAGQGEGVDRAVVSVGDGEGFNRTETFIDARDITSPTEPRQPDIPARYSKPDYPQDVMDALRSMIGDDPTQNQAVLTEMRRVLKNYDSKYDAWADNRATWAAYEKAVQDYKDDVNTMYDALRARGREKMAEYGDTRTMDMTPSDLLSRDYRHGFDLGDKGTLLDLNLDFRLTAIEEVYENGGTVLHYTYGYDANSLSSALKRLDGKFTSLMGVEVVTNNASV